MHRGARGLLALGSLAVGCFSADSQAGGDLGDAGSSTTGTTGSTATGPTTAGTTGSSTAPGGSTGEPARCGDTMVDPGETCDDGNQVGGDGCTAVCQDEQTVCGLVQAGQLDVQQLRRVQWMIVDGGFAYATGRGSDEGLHIVDLTVPTTPVWVGTFAPTQPPFWASRGLAKRGNVVYVAGVDPGVIAVDVTDPEVPVEIDRDTGFNSAGDLLLDGDALFVVLGDGTGFQAYDVSAGVLTPTVTYTDMGSHVRLGGGNGVLYTTAAPNNWLDTFEVPDAMQINRRGQYQHAGNWGIVSRVAGDMDRALVGTCESGPGESVLAVIDTSAIATPVSATTWDGIANATCYSDLALNGEFVYVATERGLVVLDLTRLDSPILAARQDVQLLNTIAVDFDDTYVYLASNNEGLLVLGGAPGLCTATCGNAAVEYPELCDDGNDDDADDCPNDCGV